MNTAEFVAKVKEASNEEFSITLTGSEWAVIANLLFLAVQTGCPVGEAKTALDKIINAQREQLVAEWPEDLEGS